MIDDLIDEAADLPYGEAKTLLLERALRQAEAEGDREQIIAVRMELTEAYQFGSEPAKSFATFSRCVSDYDAEPELFGQWQAHTLLWQYKWIVGSMRDFPQVPLSRAYDALAEMERRYREAGVGLHAVYSQRCSVAEHVGDRKTAEEWYHHWSTTPRDQMSDCEGCDPDGKVIHLAWTGRDEEAVELAAPVIAGQLICENQPQSILSCLLMPYVRTGRHAEAARAHLKAYRLIQASPHYTGDLDVHLEFCARTGNESRGLEIFQRELPRVEERATPRVLMNFLAAAGLLMRRLEELGHGALTVPGTGADVSVAVLREQLAARAHELAAAFDERNGTGEQSARVAARLAAQPLVDHLPLVPHARRVSAPSPAPAPSAATPEDLLDGAESAWRRGDLAAAFAAWDRYDEAGGEPCGRRADGLGLAAATAGDLDAADRHWAQAASLHDQAGDEALRQGSLGRLGLLRPDGLALVEASHRYLAEHGTAGQRTAAQSRLAQAYAAAGRTEEALALLGDAADGDLLALRARLEEPPAALETARAARAAFRANGEALPLARAAMLHGDLIRAHGGDLDELLGAFAEVVAAPDLGLRAVGHASRGEVLLAVDRAGEAAGDLIEAVALFTALGDTAHAAVARVDLARAYLATDRAVDAAVTAEEALAMLAPGDQDNQRDVRWTRGHALRLLGEKEAALADFTALAEEYPDPWQAARATEAAATVLDELDRDDEAATLYGAAAQAFLDVGDGDSAGRAMREHALALHWSGHSEDALDAAARARTFLEGTGGENAAFELAMLHYDEALALISLDREEEAAARCREAVERFTALGATGPADMATDLLERL